MKIDFARYRNIKAPKLVTQKKKKKKKKKKQALGGML